MMNKAWIGASALLCFAAAACSSDDGGNSGGARDAGANGGATSGGGTGGATSGGGTGGATSGGGSGGTLFGSGDSGIRMIPSIDAGPDGSCGLESVNKTKKPVNILLVIDKSGSMVDQPTGFSVNKWEAMKSALGTAIDAAKEDIDFGLELFPFPDGCNVPASGPNVPVEDGTTGVPKIVTELEGATPGGATPTADALATALDYFTTGPGADLEGDRFVLLATDGGPNCNASLTCTEAECTTNLDGKCPISANCCEAAPEDCLDATRSENRITALRNEGIDTFVVGIPGSEIYETPLNRLARAGGRENEAGGDIRYFAVDASGDVAGLTAVFEQITTQLITSCELQLSSEPPDPNRLNVSIEGEFVPKQGDNGWDLDDTTSPPTVVLKGTTCNFVEQSGVENIDIVFGCPTLNIR